MTIEQEPVVESVGAATSDEQLIAMLVDRARGEGLQLTGEGGLLQQLTKRVLESVLEGEITDHVGYEKHDPAGKNNGNSRNGTRAKTVLTDVAPVEVRVPRDVAGTFEPQIVKKRQRRLTGVGEMVLSLSAKGPREADREVVTAADRPLPQAHPPGDPSMRVCPETIYRALFAGQLGSRPGKLRTGRVRRKPQRRGVPTANKIKNMTLIHQRPAEVNDRTTPGHGKATSSSDAARARRSARSWNG